EGEVVPVFVFRGVLVGGQEHGGLRDGVERGEGHAAFEQAHALAQGEVAHAIDEQDVAAVGEDGGCDLVGPVVGVGDAGRAGRDAADHDGGVGVEVLEDVRIDGARVVGAEAVFAAGGVGVLAAEFFGRGVAVDHGVHAAGGDAEEEAGRA